MNEIEREDQRKLRMLAIMVVVTMVSGLAIGFLLGS